MKSHRLLLLVAVFSLFSTSLYAAKKPKKDTGPKAPVHSEAMSQAMQLMMPGQPHRVLEALQGKWHAEIRYQMPNDKEVKNSSGTSVNTLIYGGRFLEQEFQASFEGQTFHGMGFLGYDNVRSEYESIWLDEMSTGIMKMTGQYDPGSSSIKLSGRNSCPLTLEKIRAGRTEIKMTGPDAFTCVSYSAGVDGVEHKDMEITYTRAAP